MCVRDVYQQTNRRAQVAEQLEVSMPRAAAGAKRGQHAPQAAAGQVGRQKELSVLDGVTTMACGILELTWVNTRQRMRGGVGKRQARLQSNWGPACPHAWAAAGKAGHTIASQEIYEGGLLKDIWTVTQ
eukprot:1138426-Pelagomonas_calceolata.AAC.4